MEGPSYVIFERSWPWCGEKYSAFGFQVCLIDNELYRRTAEDLLLKCLDSDQARVAMGEVHEGICGTHQSAPKMKWYLEEPVFIGPPCYPIISSTIKDVKNVSGLVICNWCLLR